VTEPDDSVRYAAYRTKREEALGFRGLPGDKSGNFTHKVRSQLAALPALQQSHTTHRLASNLVLEFQRGFVSVSIRRRPTDFKTSTDIGRFDLRQPAASLR
jgi:hypothetical protein